MKALAFDTALIVQTAVPTGEAHRLPKKFAFLSATAGEVKAARGKIKHCADLPASTAIVEKWPLLAEQARRRHGQRSSRDVH